MIITVNHNNDTITFTEVVYEDKKMADVEFSIKYQADKLLEEVLNCLHPTVNARNDSVDLNVSLVVINEDSCRTIGEW